MTKQLECLLAHEEGFLKEDESITKGWEGAPVSHPRFGGEV